MHTEALTEGDLRRMIDRHVLLADAAAEAGDEEYARLHSDTASSLAVALRMREHRRVLAA